MSDRKPTPDILGDVLGGKPKGVWPQEIDYPIDRIIIGKRLRPLKDITPLVASIRELGLLNRIVLLPDGTLVAGYHRVEAVKVLEWTTIPAKIVEMDEIDAELAEIDENLRRVELTVLEQSEHLLRREELLIAKGVRAKHGGQLGNQNASATQNEGDTVSPSFTTADIAETMGLSEKSTRRRLAIARNLSDDVKDSIRDNEDLANSTTQLLELARMDAPKQRTIVDMIMRGDAANVVDAARKLQPPAPKPEPTVEDSTAVVGSEDSGSRQKGAELAKCSVCHRPLSDPASAIAGVGPCCANKRKAAVGDGDGNTDEEETQEEVESTSKPVDETTDDEVDGTSRSLPHVAHNSGNNEWYTPAEYIEAAQCVLGQIDLDPASSATANAVVGASTFYSADDNGLDQAWSGRVWMNPPYSTELIGKFATKLVDHVCEGSVTEAIVLVNNATETVWFRTLVSAARAVVFHGGRVRFWQPSGEIGQPLQGQAFIYFGGDTDKFLGEFSRFGWGARL